MERKDRESCLRLKRRHPDENLKLDRRTFFPVIKEDEWRHWIHDTGLFSLSVVRSSLFYGRDLKGTLDRRGEGKGIKRNSCK